jgi:hypothetical protein
LFENYYETQSKGKDYAAGWDGCKFEAYKDKDNNLILLGSSVWDSEKDAQEFCTGFQTVLNIARASRDFTVKQYQKKVDFVIGLRDKVITGKIRDRFHAPSKPRPCCDD